MRILITGITGFVGSHLAEWALSRGAQVVGAIRVDSYYTFHADGGCQGLVVNVVQAAAQRVGELPTREYEYEAPAAIVLEERGRWFRIRLPVGTAWIQAAEEDGYYPLERLLPDRLTYLTGAWDGRLAPSPGAPAVEIARSRAVGEQHVRVTEVRRVGQDHWVRVELASHSVCASAAEPTVTARGWLPAHAASGELAIWFYSRGC